MNTPKKIQKIVNQRITDKHGFICCTGCGIRLNLSYSHLVKKISLVDCLNYQKPENITLHCFGDSWKCHEKWESNLYSKMSTLHDFEDNMKRIKELDIYYFFRLINRFKDQGVGIKILTELENL